MSPSDGPPVFLSDSALPSTLKSLPALADTVLPQCPRLLTIHRPRRVSSSRFPSVGAPFDPSHVPTRRRAPGLRIPRATERSCAALVVSHHLDGLLWTDGASTVAARCRPWGSPRFSPTTAFTDPLPKELACQHVRRVSRDALTPRRSLPVRSASPLTIPSEEWMFTSGRSLLVVDLAGVSAALPSRRWRVSPWRLAQPGSTSRSLSANRSVATVRRCQRPIALSFHGLLFSLWATAPPHCLNGAPWDGSLSVSGS
jgi:hypothetical protein